MNYSKQRELILHTVKSVQSHPTAEEVYDFLKINYPALSLGTVYRNLNVLAKAGLLTRLQIPHGSDRFDGVLSIHYHAVCEKCGAIFDTPIRIPKKIDTEIHEKIGMQVTGHQLIFYGICANCKNAV